MNDSETKPKCVYAGATDMGRRRKNNEDAFVAVPVWGGRHFLLAAIDGVGGYEGGEIASSIAAEVLVESVERSSDRSPLEAIKSAMAEAGNAIYSRKSEAPLLAEMGCVATAAIISEEDMTISIAHVGDSRLYSFYDGVLTKLSHDHSVVGMLEDSGSISEEEAFSHPQRNIITRALGNETHQPDDPDFIDGSIVPVREGEQFLFCSDGLTDMVMTPDIRKVLAQGLDPDSEVMTLINMANEAGGKDNVTVVIARVGELPSAEAASEGISTIPGLRTEIPVSDSSELSDKSDRIPTPNIPRARSRERADSRMRITVYVLSVFAALLVGFFLGFFLRPMFDRTPAPEVPATPLLPASGLAETDSIPADSINPFSPDSDTQTQN